MSIITVSREFGSGGREIAKLVADALGYAYYDREIITAIAKEANLNENYVEQTLDTAISRSYPITFSHTFSVASVVNTSVPQLLAMQHGIIKKLAEKGSCVIVGRGADAILRDEKPFSVFVYSDMKSKLVRCKNRAPEDEKLSDKELERKIKQIDKGRAENHDIVADFHWGDKSGYDLCVNTSDIAVDKIAEFVAEYAKKWFEENGR